MSKSTVRPQSVVPRTAPSPVFPPEKPTQQTERTTIGTKFTLGKRLGEGAYGSVYQATDEYGQHCAIKTINMDGEIGISSLIETSIMASLIHPNLNSALRIYSTESLLYIASELAISDAEKWTRKSKLGHALSPARTAGLVLPTLPSRDLSSSTEHSPRGY